MRERLVSLAAAKCHNLSEKSEKECLDTTTHLLKLLFLSEPDRLSLPLRALTLPHRPSPKRLLQAIGFPPRARPRTNRTRSEHLHTCGQKLLKCREIGRLHKRAALPHRRILQNSENPHDRTHKQFRIYHAGPQQHHT